MASDNSTTRLGRWLCRRGIHSWRWAWGHRHWHMECRRCPARQVWHNHRTEGVGYHPFDPTWERSGMP